MDEDILPPEVVYWLSAESQYDCFFLVGFGQTGQDSVERIGAFKALLAGHSEPLRELLDERGAIEQGVRVRDSDPDTFKLFLKCIYGISHCDAIIKRLTFEGALKLLNLVEMYSVKSVKRKLIEYVLNQLPVSPQGDAKTISNVFTALSHPVCFRVAQLEKAVSEIIQYNIEHIFSHENFCLLSSDALLFIVKQETLNSSESKVWTALYTWGRNASISEDPKTIRNYISEHLKYIRFREMSLVDFSKNVVKTGILTHKEVYEVCKSHGEKLCANKDICNLATPRYNPRVVDSEVVCESTIRFRIRNISKLKGSHNCGSFQYMNLSWYIRVKKDGEHMGMFLGVKGNTTIPWSCTAEYELVLCNQHQKTNKSHRIVSKTFNSANPRCSWGLTNFYRWDSLLDRSKGFVEDDSIMVMANIIGVIVH